ncbi:hypothetical protein GF345_01705 [Candidatus Woesearchaeota archaeon]|nr:hypothetical protein [Candidatus Woesearchaeota archaeon]
MAIDDEVQVDEDGSKLDYVKAPEGKFAVYLWNCYPQRRMVKPVKTEDFDTEQEAIDFTVQNNSRLAKELCEWEYFVVDDEGCRVY